MNDRKKYIQPAVINLPEGQELNAGKWTPEEEAYVKGLVEEFQKGRLALANGTSLRQFLGKMLNCRVKRISKKFEGNDYTQGKKFYEKNTKPLSSEELQERQEHLTALEREYKQSLAKPSHQHALYQRQLLADTSGASAPSLLQHQPQHKQQQQQQQQPHHQSLPNLETQQQQQMELSHLLSGGLLMHNTNATSTSDPYQSLLANQQQQQQQLQQRRELNNLLVGFGGRGNSATGNSSLLSATDVQAQLLRSGGNGLSAFLGHHENTATGSRYNQSAALRQSSIPLGLWADGGLYNSSSPTTGDSLLSRSNFAQQGQQPQPQAISLSNLNPTNHTVDSNLQALLSQMEDQVRTATLLRAPPPPPPPPPQMSQFLQQQQQQQQHHQYPSHSDALNSLLDTSSNNLELYRLLYEHRNNSDSNNITSPGISRSAHQQRNVNNNPKRSATNDDNDNDTVSKNDNKRPRFE